MECKPLHMIFCRAMPPRSVPEICAHATMFCVACQNTGLLKSKSADSGVHADNCDATRIVGPHIHNNKH